MVQFNWLTMIFQFVTFLVPLTAAIFVGVVFWRLMKAHEKLSRSMEVLAGQRAGSGEGNRESVKKEEKQ
ncbi:hypothetical protein [Salinithrix halophila]|uniref:Uncharacterized protein n=1 Tax=Salinithrix halophila TaxID=1485204 RepID=A0ABV8JC07_9BACL